jgi:hypothetical protein
MQQRLCSCMEWDGCSAMMRSYICTPVSEAHTRTLL